MKYYLLSISYVLVMLLCANQLHAQQKTEPKKQPDPFVFDNIPLTNAVEQVSEWYQVKVNYNNIPNVKVSGVLGKNLQLSRMIYALNFMSGAKLKLKDSTIINQQ